MNTGTVIQSTHPDQPLRDAMNQHAQVVPEIDSALLEAQASTIREINEAFIRPLNTKLSAARDRLTALQADYQGVLLSDDGAALLMLNGEIRVCQDQIRELERLLDDRESERDGVTAERNRLASAAVTAAEWNRISQQLDGSKAEAAALIREIRTKLDRLREISLSLLYPAGAPSEANRNRMEQCARHISEYFLLEIIRYVRNEFQAFLAAKNFFGPVDR